MSTPPKAGRFEWERVVRHLTMPPTTKLVVLIAATFGDRDGTNIRPGNAILASAAGRSERTVQTALEDARSLGVIFREKRGSSPGRRALADVYRLSLHPNTGSPLPEIRPTRRRTPEAHCRITGSPLPPTTTMTMSLAAAGSAVTQLRVTPGRDGVVVISPSVTANATPKPAMKRGPRRDPVIPMWSLPPPGAETQDGFHNGRPALRTVQRPDAAPHEESTP